MNNQSLRLHLTITFAIMAMIPILVLGTIQVLQIRNITNDYTKTQSQTTYRLADAVQTYTYYHRNAVETLATTISASGPAFRTRESLTSKLQSVKDNLQGFSRLYIANPNGVVIAHYPEKGAGISQQPLFGTDLSGRDYFIKVKASESTTISSLFRGPEGGNEPVLAIAAPIYNDQKQFAGVAVGILDLQQIKLLVTKYDYGSDAYPVVLDPAGRAIYHPNQELTSSLSDLSGEAVVQDAKTAGQGLGKYHSDISKQSELTTYTTIKDLGWTVWVSRSYTSVNAAFSDSMRTTLILLALTLVITVIVGNLLAKRFNNTIHLLVGYTRKLADGVFEEPRREMTSSWGVPYELNMLANHFFRMAEQIKENQRALIELNAQLENRVTERTQSLSRKNQELEIVNVLLTPAMPHQETNVMIDESMRQLRELIGVEVRLRLYPYEQAELAHKEETAVAVIPVSSGNSPLGELAVYSSGGMPLPEHDRKFLLTFSNTIAVIIQNGILVSRLRHEYASLNAVLESMSDAIVLIGIQQNVVYANRRMTEMFAVPPRELLEMTEDGLFSKIAEKLSDCQEEWVQLTTKQRTQATLKIRNDNGKERILLVSAFQAAGDERIFGRGYVWRDITKEHEIDALKNDLISLASHEFKTPITSIRGGVETLLRTDAEWEESFKQELLEGIHEDIGRIQNLIDEWLDISKIDSGAMRVNRQPLRVGAVIDNAIHRLPQHALAKTEFEIDLSHEVPLIYADKLRMEQVLVNLFTNAIQYNDHSKPRIRISSEMDTEQVHILVEDNGIGIADNHLSHIFDRFYRVDVSSSRQTGGTGLGLAICKGIMEAHGGEIQVRSTPGTGSTFIISIPAFNAKEGEEHEKA